MQEDEIRQDQLAWRAAALLCAWDHAFFSEDDNGEPTLHLLCNDTFGYACADAEEVPLNDAPMLLRIEQKRGWPGLVRWIARRRGCEALPEVVKAMEAFDAEAARLKEEVI